MERLLRAGLTACDAAGRVPMGATPEVPDGPEALLPFGGEEPPGDELEVRLECWAALSKRLNVF